MTTVGIINKSKYPNPEYKTFQSSGLDVQANIEEIITIIPNDRVLIPTGLFFEIPDDYEIQVRPRSGLAFKNGITVLNTPGTIDSDYKGELKVILINHSVNPFTVNPGDRVAQIVLQHVPKIQWDNIEYLTETTRGSGGFGSTGK